MDNPVEKKFMETGIRTAVGSKKVAWAGWIITVLLALFLLFDGVMKVMKPDFVKEAFTRIGYDESLALSLGIVQIACTIVYLIPRTCVLGAILLTGYLGGATATHVRIGDPFYFPFIFGVLVWVGLYLRDERLRALMPLRR